MNNLFELDDAFMSSMNRIWKLFPGPAVLIHKGGKIVWSNPAALVRGWEPELFLEELAEDGARLGLAAGLIFSSGAGRTLRAAEELFYGFPLEDRPDFMVCFSPGPEEGSEAYPGGDMKRGWPDSLPFTAGAVDTSSFEKYLGPPAGPHPAPTPAPAQEAGGRESPGFLEALARTLKFEGGYANDPSDTVGETFRGVSRNNWPRWPGWPLIDRAKAEVGPGAAAINKKFAGDEAMARLVGDFYYANFWRPYENLALPGRVIAKIFDTAVNMGLKRATSFLQALLNELGASPPIAEDGALGPGTRAACRQVAVNNMEDEFLDGYCRRQAEFYQRIVDRKPGQIKFLKGWLSRANWRPA